MRSSEQPVTFGVERITEVAADLVLKFRNETFASMERKQNFFTLRAQGRWARNLVKADLLDKNQADIAFLRGVLYEVWQQGRACGMREENERRQDAAAAECRCDDSIG